MWGSSFAELAKKAQEQANNLSIQSPVTDLFNLDGLQGDANNDNDDTKTTANDNSNDETKAQTGEETDKESATNLKEDMKAESVQTPAESSFSSIAMGSIIQSFTTSKSSESISVKSNADSEKQPQPSEKGEEEQIEKVSTPQLNAGEVPLVESITTDAELAKEDETTEISAEADTNNTEKNDTKEITTTDHTVEVDQTIEESTEDNSDIATSNESAGENETIEPETEPIEMIQPKINEEEDRSIDDNKEQYEISSPHRGSSETLSSIETPPPGMSPTVKTLIDSTNKMFNSSTTEGQKKDSRSSTISEYSGYDDGMEEEEQNLESVSMQLALEVEGELLQQGKKEEDGDTNIERATEEKNDEDTLESQDYTDDIHTEEIESSNSSPDIENNDNVKKEDSDEENSGWTNVDVEEEDADVENTKILEPIASLNENIIDNEASLPMTTRITETIMDDKDTNDEEEVDMDESSPHSSEVFVDSQSIGNELDDEEVQKDDFSSEKLPDQNQPNESSEEIESVPTSADKPEPSASNDTTPNEISVTHPPTVDINTEETMKITEASLEETSPPPPPPSNEIPQHALEKFMEQLQRLDENHQSEIKELQKKHEQEVQEALATGNQKEDAAIQLEESAVQLKELKSMLLEKEEERQKTEDLIFDLKRQVESAGFKNEDLEKKVGTQTQSSEKQNIQLNQEIRSLKNEVEKRETANQELQNELSNAKAATAASADQYVALKTRVKSVATELKERRAECRQFYETVASLESQVSNLTSEKTKLTAQLSEVQGMYDEKDSSVKDLRLEVSKLTNDLKNARSKKHKDEVKGDSALKSYKQKAQNALAAANARAATAIQAKEEMMMEWQSTKQATLDAEKKTRIAQSEKIEADKKAKETISEMEREVEECYVKMSEMEKKVEEAEDRAMEMEKDIEVSTTEQHRIFDEMEKMEIEMEKEKQSNSELHTRHIEEKQRAEQLMKEVLELREVQKRTSTEAFMAKKKEQEDIKTVDQYERSNTARSTTRSSANAASKKNEAEGTIAMLQEELIEANETILDLKEALRAVSLERTLDDTPSNIENELFDDPSKKSIDSAYAFGPDMDNINSSMRTTNSNSETPLFYALEKQAELNIARDEINRLANVLGDAEAARMEAMEQRDEWKTRMEMAEAKVRRQEKFTNPIEEKSSAVHLLSNPANEAENMNLEYLKNVILQYLNATTVAQRKALIPVVGAVLCLTSDEQKEAVKALEYSSGLQSVGTSLIEGLETSLFGLSGSSIGRGAARRENARPERARRERRR